MKTIHITQCQQCPNVTYYHTDGEGETAPLRYTWPICSITPMTNEEIRVHGRTKPGRSIRDATTIPEWCPL